MPVVFAKTQNNLGVFVATNIIRIFVCLILSPRLGKYILEDRYIPIQHKKFHNHLGFCLVQIHKSMINVSLTLCLNYLPVPGINEKSGVSINKHGCRYLLSWLSKTSIYHIFIALPVISSYSPIWTRSSFFGLAISLHMFFCGQGKHGDDISRVYCDT